MVWAINSAVKRMIKLKNKIISLFALFSLVLILLTSLISNILIKNSFNNYVKENISEQKKIIANQITSAYENSSWNVNYIDAIALDALNNGFILTVNDYSGNIIWSTHNNYNSLCENMLNEMYTNTCEINPGTVDKYIVDDYRLRKDNQDIGILSIGYSGPIYYKNSQVVFFKALNTTLLIVTAASIVFALIIGMIVSSNISRPILNMIESTKEIVHGNYDKRHNSNIKIKELHEMNSSLDELCDALQKDERMRKNLTRDISHELRTPLTTITLQLDALIDGLWEPTSERLMGIQKEMKRLTRLVKSLEELSKYDRDNLKLHKENIIIADLLKTLLINFEKQLLDKNIKTIYNLDDFMLYVDKDMISQCIVNLISNSIKYSEENGTIYISCYSDDDYGYISIRDTGIGMAEDQLDNIFKRFYRIDNSRARKTGGSGVGLTISKAIAQSHDGTITVTSRLNHGSEFIIKIPTNCTSK